MFVVLSHQHGDRLQRPQGTNIESDFSGEKDHQAWSRGGRKNSREAAGATARRCQGLGWEEWAEPHMSCRWDLL